VAVGVPAAWWATRPDDSAGRPVAQVLGAGGSASPTPTPTDPAASGTASGSASGSATEDGGVTARPATVPPVDEPDGPSEVRFPAIGVSAPVVPVGVRPDGSMAIPKDVQQVGWYRFGPQPGDPAGVTVLAGHVDSKAQGRGAMFRMRELDSGDTIEVRAADGTVLTYRVVSKETIVKKRLPTERLFARDGPPRLVLITCGGPFLPALSSYRDNLVVVAEPTVG
jgi:LPXTG-site transpeptidase (sortase) family protein